MKKDKAFFHPHALVESKPSVGAGTRVWAFAHLMKGSAVGNDCNIGDHAFLEAGSRLGDRVTVKNGVSIWRKVTIEDDVFVGPNAVFTNDLFPVSRARPTLLPTRVRKGSCIGANATVLCGVTIGRYAFVGAGAVVTRDVPDHALCLGNPAGVRAFLCRCRRRLRFSASRASCPCGLKFIRSKNSVKSLAR